MNHNLKNSVILWVKKVQGCLAGVLCLCSACFEKIYYVSLLNV